MFIANLIVFLKKWETSLSKLKQCIVYVFCGGCRSEVSISVGVHLIPHPKKVDTGGEDAFFVSKRRGGVIAVADGVSGWAEKDVDPALFPQELMANFYYLLEEHEELNDDPQVLIGKAHAATSSVGSATVILAMLERNGILKIASVGDCGLRVIRDGRTVFSTPPQEHSFDCPYQLSSEIVGQTYLDAVVIGACGNTLLGLHAASLIALHI